MIPCWQTGQGTNRFKWSDLLEKPSLQMKQYKSRVRYQKDESILAIVVDKDLAKDDKAGTIKIDLSEPVLGKMKKNSKKKAKIALGEL